MIQHNQLLTIVLGSKIKYSNSDIHYILSLMRQDNPKLIIIIKCFTII